jgi:uncharacterized membrane protein YhaH (DUF805 family)
MPTLNAQENDQSAVLRHDTRARFWLAVLVLIQFVLYIGYVEVRDVKIPDSELIIGAQISFVTMVLGFFFGSSSGSVTKSASNGGPKT